MTPGGMGIAKLPATGSTFSAESTNNMPWLSVWPLKFNFPSCVRITLGDNDKASESSFVRSGRAHQLHVDTRKIICCALTSRNGDPASERRCQSLRVRTCSLGKSGDRENRQ